MRNGATVSPMMGIPWVDQAVWRIDWLHAVDLGVAADWMGMMLWRLVELRKFPGATQAARIDSLWDRMQTWYDSNPGDTLHALTVLTLKGKKQKFARLKCQAAVCRHLIGFGEHLCKEVCDMTQVEEAAIRHAMHHLWQCYMCLRTQSMKGDLLHKESIKFSMQFSVLQDMRPTVFRCRPKLHQLLEMGEEARTEGGLPETCWTYRDEDFGGTGAHFAKRRGSVLTVPGFSNAVLSRFFSQPFVRII